MIRQWTIVLAAAALCGLATGAPAQYQLGDGRGLDNNLQQGSGGTNAPRVRNNAGAFADAIITGNVTGLGSFRGEIDYGAPSEFRDELGSDDNFSFYRQSYDSAAPLRNRALGRRNVFGGGPNPRTLYGRDQNVLLRSGVGATLGEVTGQQNRFGGIPSRSRDHSPLSDYQTFSRSGDAFNRRGALFSEQRLAVSRDQTGRALEVTSSPLMGVNIRTLEPAPDDRPTLIDPTVAPSEFGEVQAEPDDDPRLTGLLDERQSDRVDARGRPIRETQLVAQPVALGERLGTQVLASRFVDETQPPEAGEDLVAVSRSLRTLLEPAEKAEDGEGEPEQDVYRSILDRIRQQADEPAEDDPEAAVEEAEPGEGRRVPSVLAERNAIIDEALAKLDYEIDPIESLAGGSKSLFNDAMRQAEQFMRDGRYFDAETTYNRALRLKPGYPMALVGRAHAQLGAGVFVSSARTLRGLFNNHPELIAARYAHPILPDDERLDTLADRLDAQLQANPVATGPALLWAYIAYQQRDARALGEALFQIQKRDPNDPLLPLLQRIWGNAMVNDNALNDPAED